MIGNDRGKLVMPRITGKELTDMSITGKRLLSPKRPPKDKEELPAKVSLKKVWPRNEVLTQERVIQKYLEKPRVKLPALAGATRLTNEERYDLQALLRVRCFDFSLQVRQLIPEWTRYRSNTKSSTSSSSCFRCYDPFTGGRNITRKRFPFVVYDQNWNEGQMPHKDTSRDKSRVLPLSSSVLEGQRVSLREKYKIEENDFVNRQTKRKGVGRLVP